MCPYHHHPNSLDTNHDDLAHLAFGAELDVQRLVLQQLLPMLLLLLPLLKKLMLLKMMLLTVR